MAYNLKQAGGYGSGSLGDVENPTGQICSYANVTAVTANTITIGTPSDGVYEKFVVGTEILLHVSATNGTSQEYAYLGQYMVCKITAVSGSVLTLNQDPTQLILASSLNLYIVQAITIPQFNSLILTSGSISPIVFNVTNKYGGILPIKTSTGLTLNGGNISLLDKGIPVANTAYRPNTSLDAVDIIENWAGHENHSNGRVFLNCGDGVVMFFGKKLTNSKGTASRIGGAAAGKPYMRGSDIATCAGSIGGSTIHLVAGEIEGFEYDMISKQKGTGKGLGRCYIASNTILRMDEGLYAYDCISNPTRLREMNITGYGSGTLGDVKNPTTPMNNYAKVTGISTNRKTISYSNKTSTGMAPIAAGALIMVHLAKGTDAANFAKWGKFELAKVLSDDGSALILDKPLNVIANSDLGSYNCQIVAIAQFANLTINTNYAATTAWNDSLKIGGVCAIAVKNKCDIKSGMINVEAKGGGISYDFRAWRYIGNTHMQDRLPVGAGHGSVFLLAKDNDMNTASRIGATYSGATFGGKGGAAAVLEGPDRGSNGGDGGSGYGTGGYGSGRGKSHNVNYYNSGGKGGYGGNGNFGGVGGNGGRGGDGGRMGSHAPGGYGGNGGDSDAYGGRGGDGGVGGNGGCNMPDINGSHGGVGGNGGNGSIGGVGGNGGRGGDGSWYFGNSTGPLPGRSGGVGGGGIYGGVGGNGSNGHSTQVGTDGQSQIGLSTSVDTVTGFIKYGGAHNFIVMDICNGFNMATFSTGGSWINNIQYANGWQFIYCNTTTNENYTGAVAV